MNAEVMDTGALRDSGVAGRLPARRIDSVGLTHVDLRAVLALAVPLMAGNAIQILLNLTDVWFVGHISAKALAAVGSVQLLVVVIMFVLGGVTVPVQTIVAQAAGSRRERRASQAIWSALWATLCVAPLFAAIALSGHLILRPFSLDPEIERLACEFWFPRIAGSLLGVAVWAMLGFFSGIARPGITLAISVVTTAANILFNAAFIFGFHWGIAGSGWATTAAQGCGLLLALAILLSADYRQGYGSHLTWRPRRSRLWQLIRLGVPMGLLPAADFLGLWLFQTMQVGLGTASGAATQIVLMLTSICFLPGAGIASAGTTLVAESIGAGDRHWALRVGTRVIVLAMLYMGGVGVLLALAGPWIFPLFVAAGDPDSAATAALAVQLLWLAAAYQLFDGMYLGAADCLRGAGDATVPAALVLPVSWLIFVPLAHSLSFSPGQGWVHFLPQLGWGAIGGWVAVVIYIVLLGTTLLLRWRSRAWQSIQI
jgi:multidrug resistance protein, MATE family